MFSVSQTFDAGRDEEAIYVQQPPSSHLQQSIWWSSAEVDRRAEGIWLTVHRKLRQSVSSWPDLVLDLVGSLAAQPWIAMVPRMHEQARYLFRCILLLQFGRLDWILRETSIRQPSGLFNPDRFQYCMYRHDHHHITMSPIEYHHFLLNTWLLSLSVLQLSKARVNALFRKLVRMIP